MLKESLVQSQNILKDLFSAAKSNFPYFRLVANLGGAQLAEFKYSYTSRGGDFVSELTVNKVGFVTLYPQFVGSRR